MDIFGRAAIEDLPPAVTVVHDVVCNRSTVHGFGPPCPTLA